MMNSLNLRKQIIQKGLREYLLCEECEKKLNKHETYFKTIWFDQKVLPSHVISRTPITISSIDHKHFKLFHLSVLWRAAVASIEPFDTVDLGPYEEKLRQHLYNDDPGNDHFCPFYGIVIVNPDTTVCYDIVTGPYQSRFEHSHVYYMCYAGCEWTFIVTERNFARSEYKDLTVKMNSPIVLGAFPFDEINFVKVFGEQRSTISRK